MAPLPFVSTIGQVSWASACATPEFIRAIEDETRQEDEMDLPVLGLDVGKQTVHAAVLRGERHRVRSFGNHAGGHQELLGWLRQQGLQRVHACMESTGGWSEALGVVLFEAGHVVSIVNPTRVKAFGKAEMVRTKTDRVDARLIARFCAMHRPPAWTPPPQQIRLLQGLGRRLDGLIEMRAEELTRLQAPGIAEPIRSSLEQVVAMLGSQIAEIERQMRKLIKDDPDLRSKRDLLLTIEGIGPRTAQRLLGEMPRLSEFRNAKAVAAYLGLSPREYQSGAFRGRTRLSKAGNSRLRKALYWPAIVAMTHNQPLRRFANRLLEAGKPRLLVIAAVMRKLACLAYAVLRSGRPFDLARAA